MAEKSHLDSPSKDGSADKNFALETAEQPVEEDEITIESGLRRGLLGRHVSLISLASVIGASCFYGFGYALYLSGPVGALIGFGIVGECVIRVKSSNADIVLGWSVWALMQSIGEVTTMFPIAGGFIEVRSSKFLSVSRHVDKWLF
jgi:amino acid transporter